MTASSGSGGQDPLIGRVFEGRYRILGLLGRGVFGAVYRATQLGMGREVAVKVMHPGTTGELAEVARFQQEARVLAALKHPNVVDVYDFGQAEDGTLFIAMELLRGRSLDVELAERGRIDPAELVELGLMICDALADAHAVGVVHRDLKPQNLFLADASRGRKVLKVLDFGIARIALAEASLHLTRTGAFLGSPPYMSPEQSAGHRVTAQSDLYSLGCVFYHLLVGRQVFAHTSATAYAVAHCLEPATPPEVEGQVLAGPLVDLIMSLLEKDPGNRPQGIEQVSERLIAMRGTVDVHPQAGRCIVRTATRSTSAGLLSSGGQAACSWEW